MISIRPTQNVGNEKPNTENPMMALPAKRSRRNPAHRPSGNPMAIDSSVAAMASSIVAGMRSRINIRAGVE